MKPPKKLTMDDIARLANVSKVTVSRALSGNSNVSESTRKHVVEVARENGYTVNRNAQKLREKHTSTAAVILDFSSHRRDRIADPFIFELLAGVSEALTRRKQDLMLSPSGLETAQDYQDFVRSRAADGFIFLGQGGHQDLLNTLSESSTPFVVWGSEVANGSYCTVGSDNYSGGQLVAKRFIDKGRKRVLFIGNTNHLEIGMRLNGLHDYLSENAPNISLAQLESEGFAFQESHDSLLNHLANHAPPDAIFAYSDTAAMAAIAAMSKHKLSAGSDYSLVGYNDILQASYHTPSITTIKQDTFLAGGLLVEKYMKLINGEDASSSKLPTELTTRGT